MSEFAHVPSPVVLFNAAIMCSQINFGRAHLKEDKFFDQVPFDKLMTNHCWSMRGTKTMSPSDSKRTWVYMINVGVKKLDWPLLETLKVVADFGFPTPAPQSNYANHVDDYKLLLTADYDEALPVVLASVVVPLIRPSGAPIRVAAQPLKKQKSRKGTYSQTFAALNQKVALEETNSLAARVAKMTTKARNQYFHLLLLPATTFDGPVVSKMLQNYPKSHLAKALMIKAKASPVVKGQEEQDGQEAVDAMVVA